MLEIALRKLEEVLGPDHDMVLSVQNGPALALDKGGHYLEAEKVQKTDISRRQVTLGPDHLGTITTMGNLALTLSNQG